MLKPARRINGKRGPDEISKALDDKSPETPIAKTPDTDSSLDPGDSASQASTIAQTPDTIANGVKVILPSPLPPLLFLSYFYLLHTENENSKTRYQFLRHQTSTFIK